MHVTAFVLACLAFAIRAHVSSFNPQMSSDAKGLAMLLLRPMVVRNGHVLSRRAPVKSQVSQLSGASSGQIPRIHRRDKKGKNIFYSDAARNALIRGVDKVANAVKVTLGPKGRNVCVGVTYHVSAQRSVHAANIINDGVSIAQMVDLDIPEEKLGVKLFVQACEQTDRRSGDGTTTTAVLTQAICASGQTYIMNGGNSIALQRGLIRAANFFATKIQEAAVPITTYEQYQQIAALSANSQEMGAVIADAVWRVGIDGAVIRQKTNNPVDALTFSEGMEVPAGYVEELAINVDENLEVTLENVRIFATDQNIETMEDILPLLEGLVATEPKESLLIVAPKISGDALSGLKLNVQNKVVDVIVAKPPGVGEVRRQYLEDICVFTGANFITSELGLRPQDATLADCGRGSKAVVGKRKYNIVSAGTNTEKVEKRVKQIEKTIDLKMEEGKTWECERLYQRINGLRGAVARIDIGGSSDAEVEDKNLRYEDGINALQTALDLGIVPGGGATFVYMLRYADECRALFDDDEEKQAVNILIEAMQQPLQNIAANAGESGEVAVRQVKDKEWGYGFNALTLKYENLLESAVCDPAGVTLRTLQSAASIASSLLTTEAMVSSMELEEEEEVAADYVVGNEIAPEVAERMW